MQPALINNRHHLVCPDVIATWDAIGNWEVARLDAMEAHLTPDDIVYDVGTEHGWLAGLIQRWCGGMVLFEPSARVWPNIRLVWEENGLPDPLGTFVGYVGATNDHLEDLIDGDPWPPCAYDDECHESLPYDYIFTGHPLPQTTLDNYIEIPGVPIPTVLNIDVEGAELLVLMGSMGLLALHRPTVFCSVHPDLMERDYQHKDSDVYSLMSSLGYVATDLGRDHEQHIIWRPV